MNRVVVYTADGCTLCARALEVVREVQAGSPSSSTWSSIDGDPELEADTASMLPVLEIDGERVFTYFVEPNALRERLSS